MMRFFLFILLTFSLIYTNSTAQKADASFVVLELFTSQGCSSCPPADVLLKEIDKTYSDSNVIVMSYHVDYWNRLGWKDPFSKEEFSDYQREYAIQFKSRSIYTPQLVVNGREHFTGSDKSRAISSIEKYGKEKSQQSITLKSLSTTNREINFQYDTIGEGEFDRITFVLTVRERITEVGRGENRNRTLKNSNIVANRMVKTDPEGSVTIVIPDWVTDKDELSLIAYSQNRYLEIIGSSRLELKF